MSEQELCTQYELIAALLKKGESATVIKILENAVKRLDNGETSGNDQ